MSLSQTNPIASPTRGIDVVTQTLTKTIEVLTPFFIQTAGAFAVLIFGLWLSGHCKNLLRRALDRSERIDETLKSFLTSLARYAMISLVIVTSLGVFGIPTTSFAAIIGASGLAIGLALQGTLSHIASGVMLLAFRPFEIGQYVEAAGHAGTVKKLTLFTTELATPDNKQIIIPNGEVWASSIVNYSAYGERRLDLVFSVSYNDDLDRAMKIIRDVIDSDSRVLPHKDIAIAVDTLAAHSIDIVCRPWVRSSDYTALKWSLTQKVKEQFDRQAITIPFPTQTLITESSQPLATK